MPAVVKRTVGSFSGIREADEMTVCPLERKKSRYSVRSSRLVNERIMCLLTEIIPILMKRRILVNKHLREEP